MNSLAFEDLESVYATLAEAIDTAGPANEAVFLTKLALLLADRLGNRQAVTDAIAAALQDLPPATGAEVAPKA